MLSGIDPLVPTPIGAIEPYVYELSMELARNYFVDVFGYGKGRVELGNARFTTFPYESSAFHVLKHIAGEEYAHGLLFNRYVLGKIISLHKSYPVDIIHIHMMYSILATTIVKLSTNIPVVCSVHNEVRTVLPLKLCNRILANSQFTRSSLIKKGIEPDKIDVLPIAIDTNKYKSKMDDKQAKKQMGFCDHKVILFVGRKCPEKGPQVLIKALPKIVKHNPNTIAILVGPDYSFAKKSYTYTKFLMEEAKRLDVETHIIFKGFTSENVLEQFYNAADVLVFPSVWQEPFGKVILEAMSFGKPVVASNVGGVPEIVTDGINGSIVPRNNPEALANSVDHILDNAEIARKIGENGRKTVLEKYSFEIVGKCCRKIYEELVQ